MKKLAKYLYFLPTFSIVFFGMAVLLSTSVGAGGMLGIPNISQYERLEDVINAFLSILRTVVILLLIIALMIGGYTRLTSQGDADKIAQSQKIIVSALIGFAIIVLAPVIVQFFGTVLGAQGNLFEFSAP
ncbi:MAG: hypothetical protein JNK26_01670 [Candidatus Doudnabacteria bacterium]|nr:hypothetical protein [Candidatus Doudnabacteria bacterium]